MSGSAAIACAVCFGAADGPLLSAARIGVVVMVGVTVAVLVAFGMFFGRLARRAQLERTPAAASRPQALPPLRRPSSVFHRPEGMPQ